MAAGGGDSAGDAVSSHGHHRRLHHERPPPPKRRPPPPPPRRRPPPPPPRRRPPPPPRRPPPPRKPLKGGSVAFTVVGPRVYVQYSLPSCPGMLRPNEFSLVGVRKSSAGPNITASGPPTLPGPCKASPGGRLGRVRRSGGSPVCTVQCREPTRCGCAVRSTVPQQLLPNHCLLCLTGAAPGPPQHAPFPSGASPPLLLLLLLPWLQIKWTFLPGSYTLGQQYRFLISHLSVVVAQPAPYTMPGSAARWAG